MGLNIDFTTNADRALNSVRGEVDSAIRKFRELVGAMDMMGTGMNSSSMAMEQFGREVREIRNVLDRAADRLNEFSRITGGEFSSGVQRAQTQIRQMQQQLAQVSAQIDRETAALNRNTTAQQRNNQAQSSRARSANEALDQSLASGGPERAAAEGAGAFGTPATMYSGGGVAGSDASYWTNYNKRIEQATELMHKHGLTTRKAAETAGKALGYNRKQIKELHGELKLATKQVDDHKEAFTRMDEAMRRANRSGGFMNSTFAKFSIIMSGIAATVFVFQNIVQLIRSIVTVGNDAINMLDHLQTNFNMVNVSSEALAKNLMDIGSSTGTNLKVQGEVFKALTDRGLSGADAMEKMSLAIKLNKNPLIDVAKAAEIATDDVYGLRDAALAFYEANKDSPGELWGRIQETFKAGVMDYFVTYEAEFTDALQRMLDWMTNNQETIVGFFRAIQMAAEGFANVIGYLSGIPKWIADFKLASDLAAMDIIDESDLIFSGTFGPSLDSLVAPFRTQEGAIKEVNIRLEKLYTERDVLIEKFANQNDEVDPTSWASGLREAADTKGSLNDINQKIAIYQTYLTRLRDNIKPPPPNPNADRLNVDHTAIQKQFSSLTGLMTIDQLKQLAVDYKKQRIDLMKSLTDRNLLSSGINELHRSYASTTGIATQTDFTKGFMARMAGDISAAGTSSELVLGEYFQELKEKLIARFAAETINATQFMAEMDQLLYNEINAMAMGKHGGKQRFDRNTEELNLAGSLGSVEQTDNYYLTEIEKFNDMLEAKLINQGAYNVKMRELDRKHKQALALSSLDLEKDQVTSLERSFQATGVLSESLVTYRQKMHEVELQNLRDAGASEREIKLNTINFIIAQEQARHKAQLAQWEEARSLTGLMSAEHIAYTQQQIDLEYQKAVAIGGTNAELIRALQTLDLFIEANENADFGGGIMAGLGELYREFVLTHERMAEIANDWIYDIVDVYRRGFRDAFVGATETFTTDLFGSDIRYRPEIEDDKADTMEQIRASQTQLKIHRDKVRSLELEHKKQENIQKSMEKGTDEYLEQQRVINRLEADIGREEAAVKRVEEAIKDKRGTLEELQQEWEEGFDSVWDHLRTQFNQFTTDIVEGWRDATAEMVANWIATEFEEKVLMPIFEWAGFEDLLGGTEITANTTALGTLTTSINALNATIQRQGIGGVGGQGSNALSSLWAAKPAGAMGSVDLSNGTMVAGGGLTTYYGMTEVVTPTSGFGGATPMAGGEGLHAVSQNAGNNNLWTAGPSGATAMTPTSPVMLSSGVVTSGAYGMSGLSASTGLSNMTVGGAGTTPMAGGAGLSSAGGAGIMGGGMAGFTPLALAMLVPTLGPYVTDFLHDIMGSGKGRSEKSWIEEGLVNASQGKRGDFEELQGKYVDQFQWDAKGWHQTGGFGKDETRIFEDWDLGDTLAHQFGESLEAFDWIAVTGRIKEQLEAGNADSAIELAVALSDEGMMTIEQQFGALGMVGGSEGWEAEATFRLMAEYIDNGMDLDTLRTFLEGRGLDQEQVNRMIGELDSSAELEAILGRGLEAGNGLTSIASEGMGPSTELVSTKNEGIGPDSELAGIKDNGLGPDGTWPSGWRLGYSGPHYITLRNPRADGGMVGYATGGWLGAHPAGGRIGAGSGIRDDVYLGRGTSGADFWGMGNEYVVNRHDTWKNIKELEWINSGRDMLDFPFQRPSWVGSKAGSDGQVEIHVYPEYRIHIGTNEIKDFVVTETDKHIVKRNRAEGYGHSKTKRI